MTHEEIQKLKKIRRLINELLGDQPAQTTDDGPSGGGGGPGSEGGGGG